MIEPDRSGGYIALFSEIGFILLVTTLAGVGIGYWVDNQLATLPVFVLVGLFLGIVVAFRNIIRAANQRPEE